MKHWDSLSALGHQGLKWVRSSQRGTGRLLFRMSQKGIRGQSNLEDRLGVWGKALGDDSRGVEDPENVVSWDSAFPWQDSHLRR